MRTYQNIIIGFGKAGKTLAKTLAKAGQEVLLIEQSNKMYGGTCINVGCLPSKNLIINGRRHMPFKQAIKIRTELSNKLRNKNYHMVADLPNATVLDGRASFINNHQIKVVLSDGSSKDFEGERIFINTGATPIIPNIPGLTLSSKIVTSKEIMEIPNNPETLLIIGGGYIGLEFAEMFTSYGTQVTIVDGRDKLLTNEDDDVADLVYKDMQDDDIKFELGSKVMQVTENDNNVEVNIEKDGKKNTITADMVLVATGRKPNIDNLHLENTDIKTTDRGAIKVDDKLHTTVDNVWAIGDVNGGSQFTYVSLDDFRIVKNELLGDNTRSTKDRKYIPYTAFITPPLSGTGLNEKRAQKAGYDYKVFKLLAANNPKSHVAGDTRGIYKVLVDKKTNKILGATIYALESQEVINMISLAIDQNIDYTVLRDMIYTHPTMSEFLNDVLNS